MATVFPGALDNFSNPSGSFTLYGAGHSVLHGEERDALEAIEAKVGANSSAVTTSHDYKLSSITGTSKAVPALNGALSFNTPQGYLINGKLSITVSSNNITVALKGLDGNNPSATNPVYIRIGDTVRTVSAALSVTKNAGTNWFGSGGSMFATLEQDYFVYLGYNATDGVVIGFARIPWATQYSEFSTTSTNENYCAISTITNAASTDYYEVVGRFGAILSATASFNWSVPAFTAINLIQRPIYETRTLSYVPTGTNITVGNGVMTAKYKMFGREVDGFIKFVHGTTDFHIVCIFLEHSIYS